jgi:hypothetical protein
VISFFVPLAKDLLEVPIHPPTSFEIGQDELAQAKNFGTRINIALDYLHYSHKPGEDLDFSRWECRSCQSKNFPEETVCRKCKLTNNWLEQQKLTGKRKNPASALKVKSTRKTARVAAKRYRRKI